MVIEFIKSFLLYYIAGVIFLALLAGFAYLLAAFPWTAVAAGIAVVAGAMAYDN